MIVLIVCCFFLSFLLAAFFPNFVLALFFRCFLILYSQHICDFIPCLCVCVVQMRLVVVLVCIHHLFLILSLILFHFCFLSVKQLLDRVTSLERKVEQLSESVRFFLPFRFLFICWLVLVYCRDFAA